MSPVYLPQPLRLLVIQRAGNRCEYCLVNQEDVLLPHEPDHIIAQQHGGTSEEANLALACLHCNRNKGPNISSIDPLTGKIAALYNPRQEAWQEHFELAGANIIPKTPSGRATTQLLKLNTAKRLAVRQNLIDAGRYP